MKLKVIIGLIIAMPGSFIFMGYVVNTLCSGLSLDPFLLLAALAVLGIGIALK